MLVSIPPTVKLIVWPLPVVLLHAFTQTPNVTAGVVLTVIKEVTSIFNAVYTFIIIPVWFWLCIIVIAFDIGHNHFKFHASNGASLGSFGSQILASHFDFKQCSTFVKLLKLFVQLVGKLFHQQCRTTLSVGFQSHLVGFFACLSRMHIHCECCAETFVLGLCSGGNVSWCFC